MAKRRVAAIVKIQIQAGAATPAPPVGTALGPHGINIMDFCKAYNAATENQRGTVIPAEITIYEDRTFTFITKTPPTPVLLRQAAGIEKGSQTPRRETVAKVTKDQVRQIARDQDARPQRDRHRRRDQAGRGHGALDGYRGRQIVLLPTYLPPEHLAGVMTGILRELPRRRTCSRSRLVEKERTCPMARSTSTPAAVTTSRQCTSRRKRSR